MQLPEGLEELPTEGVEATTTGKITAAPGFTVLNARQVNQRGKDLTEFAVPKGDGGIKAVGLSEAFEGRASVTYDEGADKLTDTATGKTYVPRNASWAPEDGQGDAYPQDFALADIDRATVDFPTAIWREKSLRKSVASSRRPVTGLLRRPSS